MRSISRGFCCSVSGSAKRRRRRRVTVDAALEGWKEEGGPIGEIKGGVWRRNP